MFPYENRSVDLKCKPIGRFLYNGSILIKWVKVGGGNILTLLISVWYFGYKFELWIRQIHNTSSIWSVTGKELVIGLLLDAYQLIFSSSSS